MIWSPFVFPFHLNDPAVKIVYGRAMSYHLEVAASVKLGEEKDLSLT